MGVKKLCIHFARFGPYHLTRLASAADALPRWKVLGLEVAGDDATYAWSRSFASDSRLEKITVFPHRIFETIPAAEVASGITAALDRIRPEAVAIAGWGTPDARACLGWCNLNGARAVLMSETREADGRRVWWKEWVKSRVIRRFDAALVGGGSHRDYLVKLGFPPARIHGGYNIVDNGFFAGKAAAIRNAGPGSVSNSAFSLQSSAFSSPPFFLASNRFIERKNLSRLIEAFAEFRKMWDCKRDTQNGGTTAVSSVDSNGPDSAGPSNWNLVLLGDGELRGALIAHAQSLGLHVVESAPWDIDKAKSEKLKAEMEGEAVETRTFSAESSGGNPLHSSLVGGTPTLFLPGFIQYPELPEFYARAGAFVHPALEEPWGLVLNEAMACGLPILSGNNIGAAEELVREDQNGWLFDANKVDSISSCLMQFASLPAEKQVRFRDNSRVILEEKCPVAAFGAGMSTCLGTF